MKVDIFLLFQFFQKQKSKSCPRPLETIKINCFRNFQQKMIFVYIFCKYLENSKSKSKNNGWNKPVSAYAYSCATFSRKKYNIKVNLVMDTKFYHLLWRNQKLLDLTDTKMINFIVRARASFLGLETALYSQKILKSWEKL